MKLTLAFALILTGAVSPAPSPTVNPQSQQSAIALAQYRLETMLKTGHADSSWFSASFLAQVSTNQVDQVIASLHKQLGPFQSLEFTPGKFITHFVKGTDDVLIHLDADEKIDGLLFKPPVMATSSLDDALRVLRALPGTLSYVIAGSRSERAALNPSQRLAVGSAFKLAVLNGLRDEIVRGRRRWTEVARLQSQWKSLPSGQLQAWPEGTPLTLATFAALMISVSDNTAADALIHIVGHAAIEPYADGNEPFLTTRQMFVLFSRSNADLRSAYLAAATPQARAAVLQRVDSRPLPDAAEVLTSPQVTIEWHYSVRELCALMVRVADLPLMSINPGVADPTDFRHVAYKGGSGPGAINLTTMVTTHRGTTLCFSATLNDAAHDIDEPSFELGYSGVLRQLASL